MQPEGMRTIFSKPEFLDAYTGYAYAGIDFPEKSRAIFKTTNGGRTWAQIYRPLSPISTSYLNSRTGFGVGSDAGVNLVYRTDDSGRTWSQIGTLPVDIISGGLIQFGGCLPRLDSCTDCPDPTNRQIVSNMVSITLRMAARPGSAN